MKTDTIFQHSPYHLLAGFKITACCHYAETVIAYYQWIIYLSCRVMDTQMHSSLYYSYQSCVL